MPLETPFVEDSAICQLAEDLGLTMSRYQTLEIVDELALKEAGLMRQSPDYSRIRKALREGGTVPGVRQGGVEYKLRRTV